MEQKKMEKKWYDNKFITNLLLFIFFPVGLYALWKSRTIAKWWKITATVIIGLIIIINSGDDQPSTTGENKSSNTETITSINENKIIDSLKIIKDKKTKDSIALVKQKGIEKAKRILKTFKVKKDEFEGNSFYRDPRTPYYADVNFIYPYIGEKNNNYWLRLKFQYTANDWLFINKGILLVDGDKFTITGKWERDNKSNIWEWLDIAVGTSEEYILERIANSKSAKIRYEGTQYHNDRIITSKEKSIIKKTLDIYKVLK